MVTGGGPVTTACRASKPGSENGACVRCIPAEGTVKCNALDACMLPVASSEACLLSSESS